jgi:hypothetical protein
MQTGTAADDLQDGFSLRSEILNRLAQSDTGELISHG